MCVLVQLTVTYISGVSIFMVAAADGYIGLTEWTLIGPEAVTGTFRRQNRSLSLRWGHCGSAGQKTA